MTTVTLPAGTYFIGDICYALPDDIYDLWDFEEDIYTALDPEGTERHFAVGNTKYGDGFYRGSDGTGFTVDAGNIGMVHVALIRELDEGLGMVKTFDCEVTFECDDGEFTITCGDWQLVINTGDDDDDEDFAKFERLRAAHDRARCNVPSYSNVQL